MAAEPAQGDAPFPSAGGSETQEPQAVPVIWERRGEMCLRILNLESTGLKLGCLISTTSAFAPVLLKSPNHQVSAAESVFQVCPTH